MIVDWVYVNRLDIEKRTCAQILLMLPVESRSYNEM